MNIAVFVMCLLLFDVALFLHYNTAHETMARVLSFFTLVGMLFIA